MRILKTILCLVLALPACETKETKLPTDNRLTLRGTLTHVAAIGGETTGLAIALDDPITVEGQRLTQIEINGNAERWRSFVEKRVEATGKIVFREGLERGRYPVLEVATMKEIGPAGK